MIVTPRVFRIFLITCVMVISSAWPKKSTSDKKFDPETHKNWGNLDHKHCGVSHTKRIIGGKETQLGEYPWITLIGDEDYEGTMFSCGGALLNRYYVLTADHCVACEDCDEEKEPPNIVRAGEHNLGSILDCSEEGCAPPAQDRSVAEIYRVKNYKPWPHNDIALIRVSEPFVLNDFVRPVCLPDKDALELTLTGSAGIVAGWGTVNIYSLMIHILLQKLRVRIMTEDTCEGIYREYNRTTQMCASGKSETGACNGDSGGPLVVRKLMKGRPKFVLIGVVSYGPKVCSSAPTVFTKVTVNLKWILDNIRQK